jgi:cobalt-precorrin-5B (C1)-methyltransferase
MERAHIVGMMGKLSKMANGKMQTHVAGSQVNTELLSKIAREAGASEALSEQILTANTARHALELAASENLTHFTTLICRDVCKVAENYISNVLPVHTYLFDFDGKLLAQYPQPKD